MRNPSKKTIKQGRKRFLYHVARNMTKIVPFDSNSDVFIHNYEAYHLTKEEGELARNRISRLQLFSLKVAERIVRESYLPKFLKKHKDICEHLGSFYFACELLAHHLVRLENVQTDMEKQVAKIMAKDHQIPFSDALKIVESSHLLQLMIEVPDYVKHFSWEYWANCIYKEEI